MTNGIEYKETGADPTSISAVEARKEMVADIGRYFGIPTHTLNAPAGDSETYSSTEAGNQDLVRYTLQNYIGAIEDGISDQLPHGRRMRMDPQQLLDGTWYSRMQGFQLATSGKAWMLPQEVRDRLGLPPLEDPDELNPPPPEPVVAAPGGTDAGQGK
jgi:phage portal protein BeeE